MSDSAGPGLVPAPAGAAQLLSQNQPLSLGPGLTPPPPAQANEYDAIPPATGVFTVADQSALDALSSPVQPIPFKRKALVNNQTTPIFTVDMTKVSDNTYAVQMFYAIESTDGTNVQMRSGHVIMNLARKPSTGAYTTNTLVFDILSSTGGTLTVLTLWTTSGNIATFNMQASSSLTPTDLHVVFYINFLSHPESNALALV